MLAVKISWYQYFDWFTNQLMPAIPKKSFCLLIDQYDLPFFISNDHSIGSSLKQSPEFLLGSFLICYVSKKTNKQVFVFYFGCRCNIEGNVHFGSFFCKSTGLYNFPKKR